MWLLYKEFLYSTISARTGRYDCTAWTEWGIQESETRWTHGRYFCTPFQLLLRVMTVPVPYCPPIKYRRNTARVAVSFTKQEQKQASEWTVHMYLHPDCIICRTSPDAEYVYRLSFWLQSNDGLYAAYLIWTELQFANWTSRTTVWTAASEYMSRELAEP